MSAVVQHEPQDVQVAPDHAGNPVMDMIAQAIQAGQPIEVIRELKDMAKELAADEARRAFDTALSAAKAEIPVIVKNRTVGFDSKKQGAARTNYRHEDLGEIARTVDPILGRHGLSYRFQPDQADGRVMVTCILSHKKGHSERFSLTAGHDSTGNKNSIQAIGSTVTYLQRYTLKMALGLAASADDDGEKSGNTPEDEATISQDQLILIRSLIEQSDSDIALFCEAFKVDALTDLRPIDFDAAVRSLNIKLARKSKESVQ